MRPAMKPTVLGRPGSKLPQKIWTTQQKINCAWNRAAKLPRTRTTTQRQRCSRHTLARLHARFFRNNRRPRRHVQQTTSVAHSNRNSLKPRQNWSWKSSDSRRSASKTRCQRFKFFERCPGNELRGSVTYPVINVRPHDRHNSRASVWQGTISGWMQWVKHACTSSTRCSPYGRTGKECMWIWLWTASFGLGSQWETVSKIKNTNRLHVSGEEQDLKMGNSLTMAFLVSKLVIGHDLIQLEMVQMTMYE